MKVPQKFKKFAESFFKIAEKDLERAKNAFKNKDFPDCVFRSQQCVEKCVKALLELKLRFVRAHEILPVFVEVYSKEWEKEFEKIVEALDYFVGEWSKPRYPFVINEDILLPEEVYTLEQAEKSLKLAEEVLEISRKILRKCGISV